MASFLAYAIPVLLTIAGALGLATAWVLQYRLTAKVPPEWRLAAVLMAVGIGALLSVVLTSRDLDEASGGNLVTYDDLAGGFTASRWFSVFLVVASLIEVTRGWLADRARAAPDPARPLLFAMLAYYVGTMTIQAVASDHPEFSARSLYVPILLAAVYYQRPERMARVVDAARLVILLLMLGSLAGIWLYPDFVLHRPDPGWIPGISWRLFGLAPHANSLGPIALLGILLELHAPSRWRTLRWLVLASCAAVFVLAQSKTVWAAVPMMLLFVWLPLNLSRTSADGDRGLDFRRTVLTLSGVIGVLVLLAGLVVAFDVIDFVEHRADLVTLTGRTRIWDITLQAWQENVLFGYGAGIWGPERQREFQMFYVGQAHNQIVQTLGEAGLVGVALLAAYLGTLLTTALSIFVASRGIVLMLLMLMLVRCVTEAPMRAEGILSWSTFVHVLLVVTACHYAREPRASPARDRRRAAHGEPGPLGSEVAFDGR
jgi:exopolysaccharide production protein ExoQ